VAVVLKMTGTALLNTDMKQFKATVKVGGMWVSTIVFADNPILAFKLVQSQYGAGNVLAPPTQLGH
jgi:hypothetical protein